MILKVLHVHHLSRFHTTRLLKPFRHKKFFVRIRASQDDETDSHDVDDTRSRIVDSNLQVLQERIKEVKSMETEDTIANAMIQLQKQYCRTLYENDNCEVLGLLQLDSMSKKPRLTVGVTLMVSLILPVPVLVIMLYLMDMTKGVIELVHPANDDETRSVGAKLEPPTNVHILGQLLQRLISVQPMLWDFYLVRGSNGRCWFLRVYTAYEILQHLFFPRSGSCK